MRDEVELVVREYTRGLKVLQRHHERRLKAVRAITGVGEEIGVSVNLGVGVNVEVGVRVEVDVDVDVGVNVEGIVGENVGSEI